MYPSSQRRRPNRRKRKLLRGNRRPVRGRRSQRGRARGRGYRPSECLRRRGGRRTMVRRSCRAVPARRDPIGLRTTRPVAGQPAAKASDRAAPVSRNPSDRGSSSTSRLTAERTSGTACHSSMSTGPSRSARTESGSAATASASARRSSRMTDAACRRQVVVLPVARGPMTRTAVVLAEDRRAGH